MTDFPFLYEPQEWRSRAACRGLDVNLFYPEPHTGQPQTQIARALCMSCAVKDECLDDALATFDKWGVRGGMSPNERRVEARKRRRNGGKGLAA